MNKPQKTLVRVINHGSEYAKSFKVLSGPYKEVCTFWYTLGVSWVLDAAFEQGRASDVYMHKIYEESDDKYMCIDTEIEIYPVVEVSSDTTEALLINWFVHGKDAPKESILPISDWIELKRSNLGGRVTLAEATAYQRCVLDNEPEYDYEG